MSLKMTKVEAIVTQQCIGREFNSL